jgi:hypothetical protein
LKSPGLESSLLKSSGLKGLGLKLGVEKSGVEMSFNPFYVLVLCSGLKWGIPMGVTAGVKGVYCSLWELLADSCPR